MNILLIIFALSLIGIIGMIYIGISRVRELGLEHGEITHPMEKHISTLWEKIKIILSYIAHSFAIIMSRLWARIAHRISLVYKKIIHRIEEYFKHKHENNVNKEAKTQSILLTTIKAYKKEIKKLKQQIEPDQMKPKDEIKTE